MQEIDTTDERDLARAVSASDSFRPRFGERDTGDPTQQVDPHGLDADRQHRARAAGAAPVHAMPLGFKGTTIVAHPKQPWLYVSGAAAASGGPNAAMVRLAATGLPESVEACTLDRGYCWLSIDRTARFLLGCDYGTGKVDIFPLDATGKPGERCGGADQGRKEGHCAQPTSDNKFVYVPHVKGNSALFQYAFDAATGRLAPLPGTPADDVPWGMAVSADGRFMAVTNFGSKTLSVYRIDAEGGLKRLTTVDVEDRLMDVVVR